MEEQEDLEIQDLIIDIIIIIKIEDLINNKDNLDLDQEEEDLDQEEEIDIKIKLFNLNKDELILLIIIN